MQTKEIIHLPFCQSTNQEAMSYIQNDRVSDGMIIATHHQTKGKGQRGNHWESKEGQNLTFTFIIRPNFLTAESQFQLNIISSLAVRNFLEKHIDKDIYVKWPNDIIIDRRKICGILIENTIKSSNLDFSAIGIGLNVNQTQFDEDRATSISLLTGKAFNLNQLLNELHQLLIDYYHLLKEGKENVLKREYLEHLYCRGVSSWFKKENDTFEGEIIGIDSIGRLQINVSGELRTFWQKEVTFLSEH